MKIQNITITLKAKIKRVTFAKIIVYPLCYLRLINEDQAIKLMMKIIKVEVTHDHKKRI